LLLVASLWFYLVLTALSRWWWALSLAPGLVAAIAPAEWSRGLVLNAADGLRPVVPVLPVLTALLVAVLLAGLVWLVGRVEPLAQIQLNPLTREAVSAEVWPRYLDDRKGPDAVRPWWPVRGRHGLFWAAVSLHVDRVRSSWRRYVILYVLF